MIQFSHYADKFKAMERIDQVKVSAQIAGFAVTLFLLLSQLSMLFATAETPGGTISVGVAVAVYFVLTNIEIDWEYIWMHFMWHGLLLIVVFAAAAATTSLALRGEMMAAVGAGVMFGALVGYVLGEYMRIVFALIDELIALFVVGWNRGWAFADAKAQAHIPAFQTIRKVK